MLKHFPPIIPLFLLISFASVGAQLYIAALPTISNSLHIAEGSAQFTMTIFLIGYMIGQLPYGTLANALGRRRSVYIGAAIALLGSILCALAGGLGLLATGRFISALGMAVGLNVTFTVIGDLYAKKQARRIISYVSLSFAILPALAAMTGGFLTEHLGWRTCFWALALYSVIIAGMARLLPKTGPEPSLSHLHLVHAVKRPMEQLSQPLVVVGGIMIGLFTSLVYVYATKGPFIGINYLKFSPAQYGVYNLLPFIGIVVGGLFWGWLSHHLSNFILILASLILLLLGGVGLVVTFALGVITPWSLFLPVGIAFFGYAAGYSTLSAEITSRAADKSHAAAAMSFLNILVSACSLLILGFAAPKNPLIMPLLYLSTGILLTLLYLVLRRVERKLS